MYVYKLTGLILKSLASGNLLYSVISNPGPYSLGSSYHSLESRVCCHRDTMYVSDEVSVKNIFL